MSETLDLIARLRILPVVVLDDAESALPTATALAAGGIPVAEITLRTPAALSAIESVAALDGFVVGAGTVTSPSMVDRAVDAGARFLVAPGLDPAVVARARERGVPFVPGVLTPSEVGAAVALGLDRLKLFPVEAGGGVRLVRALAEVFPTVRFLPSGGIRRDTAADYLAHPAVDAIGGSWVAARGAIAAGDWAGIERAAADARGLNAP